jgi:hypothetical protein
MSHISKQAWDYLKCATRMAGQLAVILIRSEADRVAEPEEKRHGHNVQYPPVSRKPLELIHG